MMPQLRFPEMLIVMCVSVLLFGKRLPEVGRSLGRGILEFKKGLNDVTDELTSDGTSQQGASVATLQRSTARLAGTTTSPMAKRSTVMPRYRSSSSRGPRRPPYRDGTPAADSGMIGRMIAEVHGNSPCSRSAKASARRAIRIAWRASAAWSRRRSAADSLRSGGTRSWQLGLIIDDVESIADADLSPADLRQSLREDLDARLERRPCRHR